MPAPTRQVRPRRPPRRGNPHTEPATYPTTTSAATAAAAAGCPDFDARKHRILTDLANNTNDLSPKGSVDAPITALVTRVNTHPHYYTTSSCSGRIALFQHRSADGVGKGGEWLLCAHEAITLQQLHAALGLASAAPTATATTLRFEPFILSVACRTVGAALALLGAALQAGCRESGLVSACPGRPALVSVRCSIRAELPVLSGEGALGGLGERYVRVVWERLNGKMAANVARIEAFERWFGKLCEHGGEGVARTVDEAREERKEAAWCDEDEEGGEEGRVQQRRSDSRQQTRQHETQQEQIEGYRADIYIDKKRDAPPAQRAPGAAACASVDRQLFARHSQLSANIADLDARLGHLISTQAATRPAAKSLTSANTASDIDNRCWCLLTPRQHANAVRDACKAHDWNDTRHKVTTVQPSLVTTLLHTSNDAALLHGVDVSGWVALPLNVAGERECRRWLDRGGGMAALCGALRLTATVPLLLHWVATASLSPPPSPNQRLQISLRTFLQQQQLPAATISALLAAVPHKWELLGDLALLPSDAFTSPQWTTALASLPPSTLSHFHTLITTALGCQRLAHQQPVTAGLKRSSAVQLLVGADGWVEHRENGVLFRLDVTRSMFASGNGSEKARLIGLVRAAEARRAAGGLGGEVVVDLYAGIGYFSLPLLVHTRVAHVHLCEHNPHTFDALTRSLAANTVPAARYSQYLGDNRRAELHDPLGGVADRVLLGLLPSSEDGWPLAVRALRTDTGGWMHVHGNVRVGREDEWARGVRLGLEGLLRREVGVKRGWVVRVAHVERVKSFAPLVEHLVADVWAGPTEAVVAQPAADVTQTSVGQHTSAYVYRTDGIATYDGPSTSQFWSTVVSAGRPALLRHLPLGDLAAFTPTALLALPPAASPDVSVHVCPDPTGRMDFVRRNYTYRTLPFHTFMQHVSGSAAVRDAYFVSPGERYYLRSLGADPRREVADVAKSFPAVARSFIMPRLLDGRAVMSSVLRVSSPGLALWTHYDVVPNLLCHLHGVKRVTLWPPSASLALRLPAAPHSSSSPLTDLYGGGGGMADGGEWRRLGRQVVLRPGDTLYIPALWFHHVETLPAESGESELGSGVGVSINVFWRELEGGDDVYGVGDVYGNRDVVAGVDCMRRADEAARRLQERRLPAAYTEFYLDRAVSVLQAAKTGGGDDGGGSGVESRW